jgi:hypothetical protein
MLCRAFYALFSSFFFRSVSTFCKVASHIYDDWISLSIITLEGLEDELLQTLKDKGSLINLDYVCNFIMQHYASISVAIKCKRIRQIFYGSLCVGQKA